MWNLEGEEKETCLPLHGAKHRLAGAELIYPAALPCSYTFDERENNLIVKQPAKSARLFRLIYE